MYSIRNQRLWIGVWAFFLVMGGWHLAEASDVLPRPFLGYVLWEKAEAAMRLEVEDTAARMPSKVTLFLRCEGASDYKVANEPSFSKASWQPLRAGVDGTMKASWRLGSSDIATVYVIFRRTNSLYDRLEVSRVIHDTIDRRAVEKKIQKVPHGYVNWTDLFISNESHRVRAADAGERYDFISAQTEAEDHVFTQAFVTLRGLHINGLMTIDDALLMKPHILETFIDTFKMHFHLHGIAYPSQNTVSVSVVYRLYGSGHALLAPFKSFVSQDSRRLEGLQSPSYSTVLTHMIIDARKTAFRPCLFPQVVDEDGQALVHPSGHTHEDIPYVRYLRSLEHVEKYTLHADGRDNERSLESSTLLSKDGKQTTNKVSPFLIFKAIGVLPHQSSHLIVTDMQAKALCANPKTREHLANGGLIIITD